MRFLRPFQKLAVWIITAIIMVWYVLSWIVALICASVCLAATWLIEFLASGARK